MRMPEFEPSPSNGPRGRDPAGNASDDGLFDLFAGDEDEGVALDSLTPGTVLEVTTLNTCYRIVVLDADGHALVSGGSRFPGPAEVCINGSTAGGHALRIGWIGVGLRLEMRMGARTITTSPIRSIEPVAA